jgi:endo-1,4-beta-xylanase
MSNPEVALQETRDVLFEGSMTYRIKGTKRYLTLVEALSPVRYYRAFTSDRLDGKWAPLPQADTYRKPFAGINNVTFEPGVASWTKDISHAELIRDGYDETMTIDPKNLRMLYQGRDPAIRASYAQLPYRLGLLTAAAGSSPAPAAASVPDSRTADAPKPKSPSADASPLKGAFQGKFLIGAALDPWQRPGSPDLSIATTHFSAITPENCMKPASLQPREGQFRFGTADRLVAMAEKCGATPIGHCLVWHSQTPRWFFQGPDGKPADRELALARMRKHIAAVVGRYKGRVKQWDVVNEAISDGGGQVLRRSPWLTAIGDDYIAEAFRAAHKADPNAVLIYNDYNIELRSKRRKALELLKSLIEQKVPIHAVGIQCHWRMDGPDFAEVEESIKQYAALGLKVMITELDIGVLPTRYRGADVSRGGGRTTGRGSAMNPYTEGLPEAAAQKHAERYRKAFAMFLRHRDSIERVTLWGTQDGHSWLNNFPVRGRTDYPLLFDRQGKPKPAFFAVKKLAQSSKE